MRERNNTVGRPLVVVCDITSQRKECEGKAKKKSVCGNILISGKSRIKDAIHSGKT